MWLVLQTLCKYGGIFRGLKVKGSEDNGAIGTLIYSDPGDDGPMTELNGHAPYPAGPARNPSSVQRGSVQCECLFRTLTAASSTANVFDSDLASSRPFVLPRRPDHARTARLQERNPSGGRQLPQDPFASQ